VKGIKEKAKIMIECKEALFINQKTNEIIAEVHFVEPLSLAFESKSWREFALSLGGSNNV
jgi:hypothetical protein